VSTSTSQRDVDGHATPPDVAADTLCLFLLHVRARPASRKGVGQTHRNLLFFVMRTRGRCGSVEGDRGFAALLDDFSAANMDIFGALFNGATLCTYELRRNGIRQLAGWLDANGSVSSTRFPPSSARLAASLPAGRRLPHLVRSTSAARPCSGADVELFREHTPEHCILVNHLAATRLSVVAQHVIGHSSTYAADAMIPVGRCPDGLRVDIRRDDGSLHDRNETGEIIIASPHVSPGYWRRPELNAEVFRPIRAIRLRRYFSGDFGYVDDDGNLNFLGRRAVAQAPAPFVGV
jgi:non-ribosomal peptide synthetase component F